MHCVQDQREPEDSLAHRAPHEVVPTLEDSWFRWDKPVVTSDTTEPPPAGIGDELADTWFR